MKSKPTNPTKFEEKIEKELKSLQDSVMNTSEPYIYQEDFDIERKESLRAISTLCEERVKRARVDHEKELLKLELNCRIGEITRAYRFGYITRNYYLRAKARNLKLYQENFKRLAELKGKE